MRKIRILYLLVFCCVMSVYLLPANSYAVTQISDPGLTDYDIAARYRNGLNGWEIAAIYEDPFATTGAEIDFGTGWLYGTFLDFNVTYTASTGNLLLGIDYNNDSTIAGNETISYTFSEFAGQGFQYIDMMLVGNSISDANVQNLYINGTSFGPFNSSGAWSQYYFDAGTTPSNIFITGEVNMTASGNAQERPKMEFKFGAAVVPEPISSTLFIVGGATLGFRCFRKNFKK